MAFSYILTQASICSETAEINRIEEWERSYILTQASICSETAVRSEADVDALDVTS